ncbi:cobyrinate a,c-diamide synthase [Solimonas soli]|uniref:cobyrinate a,c-diamide synthase n=1 Tax=Solimonas soli TaxID=413479 RepID=UPI0004871697|nr:cobyrinate a,c-diamide synthase [Solimonas soli]
MSATCRALLISAPASGQGKTTVTAALARRARRDGLRVRVFKTGPDFLDPMLLERASGAAVYQLDLWMVGEAGCRALLHEAALHADLILIEGVMGLYDGTPSSADLAQRFGIAVLAVIDASAMAQTFAALAFGLARYRQTLPFFGVFANRVGSAGHARMLADGLPDGIAWLGHLPRAAAFELPERHLGLLQAGEIADLDRRLDAAADALGGALDFASLPTVAFSHAAAAPIAARLAGQRIAVARDEALGFIYPANLDCLHALGAETRFFSPLRDAALPACDAVWLPGGYPELHAARLAANTSMLAALRAHHAAGKPLLAECGGLMAICRTLVDGDGVAHALAGLLDATATMQPRLQALALQGVAFDDGELRGHSFHYSSLQSALAPTLRARTPHGGGGEAVYRDGALIASYVHFHFASNPSATARLFGARP